ncbi:MAG: metallophosphoesterase [Spirochaetales bacterium]|nr:metallophosphoesterase [Spirochaetales bacterium]
MGKRRKFSTVKIAILSLCVIFLITCVYGIFIERYIVETNLCPLDFPQLPEEFENYRICVFSDLHYKFFISDEFAEEVIDKINKTGANLVLGLGDYVHSRNTDSELDKVWPMLKRLKAPDGVFLVNGNHDHWANPEKAIRLLEQSGYSLRHKKVRISKNHASILLAGEGELWGDYIPLDQILDPADTSTFTIVLTHHPESANLPHSSRVDLFLAGHTHGGQVRFPFTDISPFYPFLNITYGTGLSKTPRNESIFVTKGIGCAVFPIRIGCLPEIVILELHK